MASRRNKRGGGLALLFLAFIIIYNKVWIDSSEPQSKCTEQQLISQECRAEEKDLYAPNMDNEAKRKDLLQAYLTDRPEEIVWHEGFVLSYNNKHKLPNWVSWLLTDERTRGTEKRADNFQPDATVRKGPVAQDADYRRSGYDRGHMCPAADCKHSRASQNDCFLLTNICPQTHALNAGDWKQLEELSRNWARKYDSIYIVCGPVLQKSATYATIGSSHITVPKQFFKVLWRFTPQGGAEAIGFLFNNDDSNRPLSSYVVSVDSVEALTGINFFSKFPRHLERAAESSPHISSWKGLK